LPKEKPTKTEGSPIMPNWKVHDRSFYITRTECQRKLPPSD